MTQLPADTESRKILHHYIEIYLRLVGICGALRDLVLCARFKKCKNTHGEVLLLVKLQALKVTLPYCCFLRFLNCTNGTKSRKASHIILANKVIYFIFLLPKVLSEVIKVL